MVGQVLAAALGQLFVASAWACDVPAEHVRSGMTALLSMELGEAETALGAAEEALGCAQVTPEELAEFWILEGAIATFRKDAEGAAISFRAAGRVAPDHFPTALGRELETAWRRASEGSRAQGVITVENADGYELRTDAGSSQPTGMVDAGLHLVQVLEDTTVRFGRVVLLTPDTTAGVDAALPPRVVGPPDPPIEPPPPPAVAPTAPPLTPFVSLGAAFASTSAVDVDRLHEGAVRLAVPLELGVRLALGRAWARGAAGVAPVPTGVLLYQAGEEVRSTRFGLDGHVAGGVSFGAVHAGGLVGAALPGRSALRLVGGYALPDLPLTLEARAGVNLVAAERAPEPALSVHIAFAPLGGSR